MPMTFVYHEQLSYSVCVFSDRRQSLNETRGQRLHGPSVFAVKTKIYGVLYNQSTSIAFDETSSYWSAPKIS